MTLTQTLTTAIRDPRLRAFSTNTPTSLTRTPSRTSRLSNAVARRVNGVFWGNDPWVNLPVTTIPPAAVPKLTHILSLPPSTHLLPSEIASLGPSVSRKVGTPWPRHLCHMHTWLEPAPIAHLTKLIAMELWDRSETLYAFPRAAQCESVRAALTVLEGYRPLFVPGGENPHTVQIIGRPADAFAGPSTPVTQATCSACKLSRLFQNAEAVNALAVLCKGRKKRHWSWPELLAFVDPVDVGRDEGWYRRWRNEGSAVRRERRRANVWAECEEALQMQGQGQVQGQGAWVAQGRFEGNAPGLDGARSQTAALARERSQTVLTPTSDDSNSLKERVLQEDLSERRSRIRNAHARSARTSEVEGEEYPIVYSPTRDTFLDIQHADQTQTHRQPRNHHDDGYAEAAPSRDTCTDHFIDNSHQHIKSTIPSTLHNLYDEYAHPSSTSPSDTTSFTNNPFADEEQSSSAGRSARHTLASTVSSESFRNLREQIMAQNLDGWEDGEDYEDGDGDGGEEGMVVVAPLKWRKGGIAEEEGSPLSIVGGMVGRMGVVSVGGSEEVGEER